MQIITEITEVPWDQTAVSIGKFEGLHIGHQKLINKIVEKQRAGFVSVAFTFDQSPRDYFGKGEGMLFTREERRSIFEEKKLDCLLEYPFTKELANMEAERFIEELLCKKLHTRYLVVGPDFCFGRGREGTVRLLQQYAQKGWFQLEVVEKERDVRQEISSTRIRKALAAGEMAAVQRMLGFPFFMDGKVISGNRLGRTWGIPTANIQANPQKLLPPNGVYFSEAEVNGTVYKGITNLGNKPTIGEQYCKGAETYLYDFSETIYGEWIRVSLLEFHRGEQKFSSLEHLVKCLKYDIDYGKHFHNNI